MSRTIKKYCRRETLAFAILGFAVIAVAVMFLSSTPGAAAGKRCGVNGGLGVREHVAVAVDRDVGDGIGRAGERADQRHLVGRGVEGLQRDRENKSGSTCSPSSLTCGRTGPFCSPTTSPRTSDASPCR